MHAERAAPVPGLADLGEHVDWTTPSLCAGWDIRDVLVHLAATATLSLTKFAAELVDSGFRPPRMHKQITSGRKFPRVHALDSLRSAIDETASPPQPTITRLIEIVVHGEDIRRPLHITHAYDTTHLAEALTYLSHDHLFGAKTLVQGTPACRYGCRHRPRARPADRRRCSLPSLGNSRAPDCDRPAERTWLRAAEPTYDLTVDLEGSTHMAAPPAPEASDRN